MAGVSRLLVRTDHEAVIFGLDEGISLFVVPCLSPVVYPYPERQEVVISRAASGGPSVATCFVSKCSHVAANFGDKTPFDRVLDLESDHACLLLSNPCDVWTCPPSECLMARGVVIVFVLEAEILPAFFFLALMMPPTPPLHAMGYVMKHALISCDDFAMVMGFESCDVCWMMANGEYCYVLACQSLACPVIPDLYSSRVPPPSNLEWAILNVCVCGHGCGLSLFLFLEVCRRID